MSYSISDFKVGQRIDTPAKIKLWEFIIRRTFGGLDCAMNQYEKYSADGSWQSYKINGMITYMDELTGGDYGRNHERIQRVAGTLAVQFKKKFPSIHYLLSNTTSNNVLLDREFNISPPKPKVTPTKKLNNQSASINRSKVYSILAKIYEEDLSPAEAKFIGQNILDTAS